MPRTERSDQSSGRGEDDRPELPEGTEHVVVIDTSAPFGSNPTDYRVPASRLAEYDDVDLEEYVDEDEDPEDVRVFFEPGDELPLPVAADGTYRAHANMFACFSAEGERLDSAGASSGANEGVQQWRAGGN